MGSREGIWWLPNSAANDYLVVTNQGQNALQAKLSVFDAAGKPSSQIISLAPRAMVRYSIRQIVAAAGLSGSYGGVKVSAASHAGSLDTLHVVFDQNGGFSAVMKMFDYDPRAQVKERDYAGTGVWTLRAPMLALSNPDPALAFPVGTILDPQLFIHNNIARIAKLNLSFHWHSDSADGQVPATALQLAPFETQRIDVASLPGAKAIPADAHWASVTLTTDGLPDEVIAVAASYDSSLRYGAQTPFSDQLALQWEGGMWRYDPEHDSIITTGNGSTKPTQAAFTIFYNQGTQKYELDQTLHPGQQMWMDIGKLIREGIPDKDGNILPTDLTSGSYDVRDLTNNTTATLFEGKVIYDKTYGHVTYGCAACCGYGIPYLWYNPISVLILAEQGDGVWAPYPCESATYDVSSTFYNTWVSDSTPIVTVDAYGTHTGVSVGSTDSYCAALLTSNDAHERCPALYRNPQGGVNVQVPTSLQGPSAVKTTYAGQELKDCYGQSMDPAVPQFYGYEECESYTVLDQNGVQIKLADIQFDENVTVTDTNVGLRSYTGSGYTDANFVVKDMLALGSATAPPAPGSYAVAKQIWTAHSTGNVVRVNCLDFESTDVSITDITGTPTATCSRN